MTLGPRPDPPPPQASAPGAADPGPQEGGCELVTLQTPGPMPDAAPSPAGSFGQGPAGVPAQGPSSLLCPMGLTLLTGLAGPALRAGAVARDRVAGAPVAAEAGVLAVLAEQARGAGWGEGSACSTHSQASGRPPPGGPAEPAADRGQRPHPPLLLGQPAPAPPPPPKLANQLRGLSAAGRSPGSCAAPPLIPPGARTPATPAALR